jgi:hypothetical protein
MTSHSIQLGSRSGSKSSTKFVKLPSNGYMKFTDSNNGFSSVSATDIVNDADPSKIKFNNSATPDTSSETIYFGPLNSDVLYSKINPTNVNWRTKISSSTNVYYNSSAITSDAIYITAYFNNDTSIYNGVNVSSTWGTPTATSIPFLSSPPTNLSILLVKYDLNGNLLWRTKISNLYPSPNTFNYERSKSIAITISEDSIYLSDIFLIYSENPDPNIYLYNAVTIDNEWSDGTPILISYTPGFNFGRFIVKYDLNGNIQWRTMIENAESSSFTNIINYDGHIYLSSYFQNGNTTCSAYNAIPANNDWDNLISKNFILSGTSTILYLIKYNSSGQIIWRTYMEPESNVLHYISIADDYIYIYYISSDISSNIYNGVSDELWGSPAPIVITTSDPRKTILIKYDLDGILKWRTAIASQFGSIYPNNLIINSDYIYVASINTNSNSIIYRTTNESEVWNSNNPITIQSGEGLILIKYDLNGTMVWRTFISNVSYFDVSINTNYNNNKPTYLYKHNNSLYVCCINKSNDNYVYNAVSADDAWGTPQSVIIPIKTSYKYSTILIKYNLDGILQWRTRIDSLNDDNPIDYYMHFILSNDNIYISHRTNKDILLYNTIPQNNAWLDIVLTTIPNTNIGSYIIKYNSDGKLLWRGLISNARIDKLFSISNSLYVLGIFTNDADISIPIGASKNWINNSTDLPISGTTDTFVIKYSIPIVSLDAPKNKIKYVITDDEYILNTNDLVENLPTIYNGTDVIQLLPADKWIKF